MKKSNFRRMLAYIPNWKRDSSLTFVLIIFGVVVTIASAILLQRLTDASVSAADEPVVVLLLLLLTATFLAGLIKTLQDYLPYKSILKKGYELKINFIKKTIRIPYRAFAKFSDGDILNRTDGDITSFCKFIGFDGVESLSWILAALCCIAYIFTLSWKMALFSFLATPVLLIFIMIVNIFLGKIIKKSRELQSSSNTLLLQNIHNSAEIRVLGIQEQINDDYEKLCADVSRNQINYQKWQTVNNFVIGIGSLIPISVTFLYGSYLVYTGELSVGGWVAYFLLLDTTNSILNYFGSFISGYRNASVSAGRVMDILSISDDTDGTLEINDRADKNENILEFRNVRFSYEESEENRNEVLNGVSFSVKQGEKVCIVGSSGSGKSTVHKLIGRLYTHDSGEILLKGTLIGEIYSRSLWDYVAFVSQSSSLFGGAVDENIAYGNINIEPDSQLINKVAETVHALGFINEMPEGLRSVVSESGKSLSGGQRQRICIARALYKNSALLCMDEATSAIDMATEEKIIQNLLQSDRTCLFVAHRLSAYKDVDRIIVLEQGKIAEEGSFDELMELRGRYFELYTAQEA